MAHTVLQRLALALVVASAAGAAGGGNRRSQPGRGHCTGSCLKAAQHTLMSASMEHKLQERAVCEAKGECPFWAAATGSTPCTGGMAGEYPCKDVDLQAFVPLLALGTAKAANDIWGWTDPETGREYAVVGLFDGTSFVDVTVPTSPTVVGFMKTQTEGSVWRDMKVHSSHAFVVSEASDHGMQVFDLTRLRSVPQDIDVLATGQIQAELGSCLEAQSMPWWCLEGSTSANSTGVPAE